MADDVVFKDSSSTCMLASWVGLHAVCLFLVIWLLGEVRGPEPVHHSKVDNGHAAKPSLMYALAHMSLPSKQQSKRYCVLCQEFCVQLSFAGAGRAL